jgi:hypothetical protein
VCNGSGFTEDDEGTEHPDLAAARANAIKGLRDILAGEMQCGELDLGSFIEIEDEQHKLLMTVPVADVLTLKAPTDTQSGRDR